MPVSYLRSLTCAAALLLTTGPMAVADGLAGAYLAGRAATYDSDFAAGAKSGEIFIYDDMVKKKVLTLGASSSFSFNNDLSTISGH